MKVYIANIFCPYEGGTYARGVFSTKEKAEQAATWFTEHAAYFRENHHKSFGVTEYEIDDRQEFDTHLQTELQYMKYIVEETDEEFVDPDRKAEVVEMYTKLKPLHKEEQE